MSGNEYFGELAPAGHSRKKAEMVSALAELDTDEDFWPTLVSRLSDGEFLSAIAEELKVNHSILRNWIRGSKARETDFVAAFEAGRQARIHRVLQKTYDAATADIAEPTTRMEQLRAAEVYLRQQPDAARPPSSLANLAIVFVQADNGKPLEKVIDPVS